MHFPSKHTVPLLSLFPALLLACGDTALTPVTPQPKSGFSVARLMTEQYLVVKISVTADDIQTGAVALTRGPKKTNSTIADLMVIPTAGEQEIGVYAMPDPRFQRLESAGWRIADSADTFIFVPLSADIDLVTIRPVRGREHVASKGGNFNPFRLAAQACSRNGTGYSGCDEILEKLRSWSVEPD